MKYLFSVIGVLLSVHLMGQDLIYLKDNSKLETNVLKVTDKTVSYKLLSNPTGPEYIIRTSRVTMIIYEDGSYQHFLKNRVPIANFKKNIISNNQIDWFDGRLNLSYERLLAKGNLGIRFIAATLLYDGMNYYNLSTIHFFGIDHHYYPHGQRKIAYFTGIWTRAGVLGDDDYIYNNTPPYGLYAYDKIKFVGTYVANGIKFNLSKAFSLSAAVGTGVRANRITGTNMHAIAEINASLSF